VGRWKEESESIPDAKQMKEKVSLELKKRAQGESPRICPTVWIKSHALVPSATQKFDDLAKNINDFWIPFDKTSTQIPIQLPVELLGNLIKDILAKKAKNKIDSLYIKNTV